MIVYRDPETGLPTERRYMAGELVGDYYLPPPDQIEAHWSDNEINSRGLARVPDPAPPPEPARFPFCDAYLAVRRVADAGKADELEQLVSALPAEQRQIFTRAPYLWCDDPAIRAAVASLGLDPAVILAPTTWRRSVAEA